MAHLRFATAFGEETIELPPRSVDQPFTIGRGNNCDLQVPSLAVSARHCVLFQHKGRWAVQDAGSEKGTFINGIRLTAPRALSAGDVLALGQEADPPTMVIDGPELGQRPVNPRSGAASAGPAYMASVVSPPPAAKQQPYMADLVAAPPPAANDWFTQRAASPSRASRGNAGGNRHYVHKRQGMSPAAWTTTIVMALGLCIGGYFLYQWLHRPPPSEPAPAVVVVPPKVLPPHGTVFDQANPYSTPAPAAPAHALPAPTPVPTEIATPPDAPEYDPTDPNTHAPASAPAVDMDPLRQTDEWAAIQVARDRKLGMQLVKACQNFNSVHSGSKLAGEVDRYLDEGCDIIWWNRVDDLMKQCDLLREQLKGLDGQYAESESPDFKKDIEDQRGKVREELQGLQQELTVQRGYTDSKRPNLYDLEMMRTLRAARDPKAFADFKKEVASSIRHSNKLPW